MKDNFFNSMLSEEGKISSKRWISVTTSATICFGVIWIIVKYKEFATTALGYAMIFVGIMSGVATVAQVADILMRRPAKAEPPPPPPSTTTTTTTETKTEP